MKTEKLIGISNETAISMILNSKVGFYILNPCVTKTKTKNTMENNNNNKWSKKKVPNRHGGVGYRKSERYYI